MKRYPAYKDSGMEWIGKIPVEWDIQKLKYLIEGKLTYGANEVAEEGNPDNPRYIRITDFDNEGRLRDETFKSLPIDLAKDYLLKEGDVLFARSGATVGKTFQFKKYSGIACFAGYLIKASPQDTKLDSDFLYFYTKSGIYENWKDSIFIQATIQNIGADKYSYLPVPHPPFQQQKTISLFLEHKTRQIDNLIAKKQKLIELLKEERTALINHAVTKGLDPTVPMKDSGIEWFGEIPENWDLKRLKQLVKQKLQYGANETGIDYNPDYPRYIRITDFDHEGNLRNDTLLSLDPQVAQNYLLNEGDILFARSGATVGKTFIYRESNGKACFAGYLIKASTIKHILSSDFLYYLTQSNYYENWKESIFSQATIQNIGADKYQDFLVPVPSIDEQRKIVLFIDSKSDKIKSSIKKIQKEIDLISEYKASLINEVVTGKIKVSDAN